MNPSRLYQILRAPHVSEKASRAADKHNQVVFEVLPGATKPEIKQAVETLFKVDVVSVQVVNVKGKVKRFGSTPGRRKNRRKAYVRLKAGQDIDFAGM